MVSGGRRPGGHDRPASDRPHVEVPQPGRPSVLAGLGVELHAHEVVLRTGEWKIA
ncbi:hypothetical protein [Streptosporangium canum]|uniref:hypothetical protein n=1 Tax=Streptosporangium canum TaxID=324952 RepID=UPI0015A6C9D2|nr:hypothetical protein [Streptosporangium canum]